MSPKKQLEIENYCLRFVAVMFAQMHNKVNAGPTFTWAKFPEMMFGLARNNVSMCVKLTKKIEHDCEAFAAEYAENLAKHFVKEAGYV